MVCYDKTAYHGTTVYASRWHIKHTEVLVVALHASIDVRHIETTQPLVMLQ